MQRREGRGGAPVFGMEERRGSGSGGSDREGKRGEEGGGCGGFAGDGRGEGRSPLVWFWRNREGERRGGVLSRVEGEEGKRERRGVMLNGVLRDSC